jgi:hypothetical protein
MNANVSEILNLAAIAAIDAIDAEDAQEKKVITAKPDKKKRA